MSKTIDGIPERIGYDQMKAASAAACEILGVDPTALSSLTLGVGVVELVVQAKADGRTQLRTDRDALAEHTVVYVCGDSP